MKEPIGDLHIDDFCKDTAKILLMLFRRFPVKTTLYVEDISGPDTPDEFGLHSPRFESCFSAMVWLKDADYIHYSTAVKQEAVEEAVLSHRGFNLLTNIDNEAHLSPHAEASNQSEQPMGRRIDHIKHTIQHGSSEALKILILRYMMKSRDFL